MASKYSSLAQTPCAKTAKSCAFCDSLPVFVWHRASFWHRNTLNLCNCLVPKPENSAFAEFRDCLPVSASVCVFAFDTGGLGLWLGAFEKSGLYRCQSVPGPPMPCFVARSFVLAAFATLVCQRNCVFLCKGTKLQKAALFAIVCRFLCGTELRFGSLCNLGLSKKLRFSLQRHKT